MPTDQDPAPEPGLKVRDPAHHAAGVKGVAVALQHAVTEMGASRTARTLTRINQPGGFDCMSCAWPDPDPEHRHAAEFCENGAKAVADEATRARIRRDFFADHDIDSLLDQTDHWLGKQGRLTEPMVKRPGSRHYEPISWDEAFRLTADHLGALESPHGAAFYTSGRASNEAAFLYQLFVRAFGTNNLPDCSNMCHEASGIALVDAIGIGKGSVSLEDFAAAELILLVGQNPGTNHPRMLSALEDAKRRGAKIIAINPLDEAGSRNFRNPQRPRGVVGRGTDLADLHLPIKVNGDMALFQAIGHLLHAQGAIDDAFIAEFTTGFEDWATHIADFDWDVVDAATGLSRDLIEQAAAMVAASGATIWCWAMGLTQHRNSVDTIRELVNLALLRGDVGKPGAGLCPVRGHSNVQGDRTMGIWERPTSQFLDAMAARFDFEPPRDHGFDVVETIEAMLAERVTVLVALGGNFLQAAPDTGQTTEALEKCSLTVQISTKLNRSHLVTGDCALILPTLGRTEADLRGGAPQFVTVEDSMSVVHASTGRLEPASPDLLSEVAIISEIAEQTLGTRYSLDWAAMRTDYALIRDHIEHVVPGFDDFEARVRRPGGFVLPHPPRDSRTFATPTGLASFAVADVVPIRIPSGQLLLQTLRSHDQFNTTIYGLDDRYRGIRRGRKVVFVHPDDIRDLGLEPGQVVDLLGHWEDGRVRRVFGFRVVAYATPRGTAAAYYPETNPLVPLASRGERSNTPTSKSVLVSLTATNPD